jgi:hypothetical protein
VKKMLERELAQAKVYVNRVAATRTNEWKDDANKLMPVKMWLEEQSHPQVQKRWSDCCTYIMEY